MVFDIVIKFWCFEDTSIRIISSWTGNCGPLALQVKARAVPTVPQVTKRSAQVGGLSCHSTKCHDVLTFGWSFPVSMDSWITTHIICPKLGLISKVWPQCDQNLGFSKIEEWPGTFESRVLSASTLFHNRHVFIHPINYCKSKWWQIWPTD